MKEFRKIHAKDQESPVGRLNVPSPWKPALNFDLAQELGLLARLAVASKAPYTEAWKLREEILAEIRHSHSSSGTRGTWVGMTNLTFKLETRAQAMFAVSRAGMEFEYAFLKDGHYPETTAITDPYTGNGLQVDMKRGIIFSVRKGDPEELQDPTIRWTLKRRP